MIRSESRRNPARCIYIWSAHLVLPSPSNAGRLIILIDSHQFIAAPSESIQSLPVALFTSNQLSRMAVALAVITPPRSSLNSSRHVLTNRIEMNSTSSGQTTRDGATYWLWFPNHLTIFICFSRKYLIPRSCTNQTIKPSPNEVAFYRRQFQTARRLSFISDHLEFVETLTRHYRHCDRRLAKSIFTFGRRAV